MWRNVWFTVGFKNDVKEPIKTNLEDISELIEKLKEFENDPDVECVYVNAWKYV